MSRQTVDVPSSSAPCLTVPEDSAEKAIASPLVARLGLVLVSLIPLFLMRGMLGPVRDPDAFWHIRAGEYLWKSHSFTGPEPWSRFSTRPWTLHEWLPELGMFATYRLGGLPAVAWLSASASVLMFVLLYLLCREFSDVIPAGIAAVVAWVGMSASLGPRPQMLSFFFVCVTTLVWLRTVKDGRPRLWLVLMAWLWACCHGMWFLGPLLGFTAILGMLLDGRFPRRRVSRLAVIPTLGVVMAAVTPVGPALLRAPFSVGNYTQYVSEWAAPNLRDPYVLATHVLALLVAVTWSRSRSSVSWAHIGLWVVAVGWSLLYSRTVVIAACMLAPLAAEAIQRFLPSTQPHRRARAREAAVLTGSALLSFVVAAFFAPAVAARPADVPDGLDTQLSALPSGTVVYNTYGLGGWLLLSHPQLDPVIDGRTEVFSVAYVDRYVRSLQALPGWLSTVRASGAQVALLERDTALLDVLERQHWRDMGHDNGYVLLRAPSS